MINEKKSHWIIGLILGTAFLVLGHSAQAQTYEFKVEHHHLLRNCRGILTIDQDKIEYQTKHKKDARVWRYEDLKRLEVVSPTLLHIVTYENQGKFLGADRTFEFKLLEDSISQEVNDFLLSRTKRPLVTSVIPKIEPAPTFEIGVKHRHTLGGCEGVLKIYRDAIVFESRKPKHSRYWRYSDIRQIGRLGPYQFQVTTFEDQVGGPDRVFNFDLKRLMDDTAYDYVWVRVNRTQYYPYGAEHAASLTRSANRAQLSGGEREY